MGRKPTMVRGPILDLIRLMDTDYKKSGHKKSEQYLKAEKMLFKKATAQELLFIMETGESFEWDIYFKAFLNRKDGQAMIDILDKNIDLDDSDIYKISKVLIEIGEAKYIYEFIVAIPDLLKRLIYKDGLTGLMNALSKSDDVNTLILVHKSKKLRSFEDSDKIFNRILEIASVDTLIRFVNDNFENVNFPNNTNTGYLTEQDIAWVVDTICDKATPYELKDAVIYMHSKLTEKQKEQLINEQIRKTTAEEDAIYLAQVYVDIKLHPSVRRDILKKIDELDAAEAKEYVLEYGKNEDYERKILDPKFLTVEQEEIENILTYFEKRSD